MCVKHRTRWSHCDEWHALRDAATAEWCKAHSLHTTLSWRGAGWGTWSATTDTAQSTTRRWAAAPAWSGEGVMPRLPCLKAIPIMCRRAPPRTGPFLCEAVADEERWEVWGAGSLSRAPALFFPAGVF
jgi:hypothetical protein